MFYFFLIRLNREQRLWWKMFFFYMFCFLILNMCKLIYFKLKNISWLIFLVKFCGGVFSKQQWFNVFFLRYKLLWRCCWRCSISHLKKLQLHHIWSSQINWVYYVACQKRDKLILVKSSHLVSLDKLDIINIFLSRTI